MGNGRTGRDARRDHGGVERDRAGHGAGVRRAWRIGGLAPVPFASGYTASKFGLRGFHASLRQELADHPGIRVCAVFPASIDTPAYGRGANVSGRALKPGPPVYPPKRVVQALLFLALHPRDEVAVGWPSTAGRLRGSRGDG
ncbi:hypothetical protein DAETH_04690 [Deinococcus aetherius]|uniref:SDR family NAD(P)-dependent oxidoreductase n=1 Tax=Deinococcus aetherius TaxID=200252 RepID=A0ABN6RCF5_9DEIO|nr:SDR family NAD(P)-dependent oxidoreductase [Deinococcus aetherius]BDP40500.1 hypothetical protein DAETH_04690 [Deinococcus aetherius]